MEVRVVPNPALKLCVLLGVFQHLPHPFRNLLVAEPSAQAARPNGSRKLREAEPLEFTGAITRLVLSSRFSYTGHLCAL